MSKEIAKVKFDAGFETNINGNVAECSYKDENVFIANLPETITKTGLQDLNKYKGQFSQDFLSQSVETAKETFKKHGDVKTVNTSVAFGGVNKGDKMTATIIRDVEQTVPNFNGGAASKVTTSVIKVAYQQTGNVSKAYIKQQKQALNEHLYGNK